MPPPLINKQRRNREVRDIHNKLRKKYTSETVMTFIEANYFIGEQQVYEIIRQVDTEPVTNPSIIYQNVMRDDFYI